MARKPRLISAPPASGGSTENGWKQLSGTMGALAADQGAIGVIPGMSVPDAAFEAPEDLNYERTIAERERELGLPPTLASNGVSGAAYHPPVDRYAPPYRAPDTQPYIPPADLSPLPGQFTLSIERKGEMWKVTAPSVHTGLWKAGSDLPQVVNEALASLAEMVSIDGIQTKGRRK